MASASARVAGARAPGHVNPKYGSEPGRLFYTHISDQYAPFSTRVVNCRRPRFHLCARRPAVPRVRPADRGALHPTRPASPITSLP
ncbi:Tn3 family transposase [Escherichia coli]|uniref:Tn3 family transposase n=1 Tax=Escherichia coli TaxID=562 RepID=UPI003A5C7EF4